MNARSAREILALSKAASGGDAWDRVHTIRLEGEISLGGLTGQVDQSLIVDSGSSLLHFKLGPIEQRQGFDGKKAWSQDSSGGVISQDSEAAKQSAATDAYIDARAYWYPQRWAAKVKFGGTRTASDKEYLVLHILPHDGQPIDLWIDSRTHLIDRTVKNADGLERCQRWLDYRNVDGAMLPFRLQASKGGDTRHEVIIQFNHVAINDGISTNAFVAPVQQLNDFAFLDGTDTAIIPFGLVNNHIYVSASINGHPLQLMLDTGGVNILTPEAAARAGVNSQGALKVEGPGKDSSDAGLAQIDSVTVGDKISMTRQTFRVIPLPGFHDVEGTSFDGLIGFEVFKRFVVRIDYANQNLTFVRPSDFCGSDSGTPLPLTFFRTTPLVHGMLDGLPAQFEVDTGSRAALTLWAPFANAHGLLSRYDATAEMTIGWGVGGKATGHAARGGELHLGNFRIQRPVLTIFTDTAAATSRPKVDGNIGGDILRRFVVTFDYSQQMLYLLPNLGHAEEFTYDRSGMWINNQADGFEVKTLMPNGPAERAGLKVGDLIVAVDGLPARSASLAEMRRKLQILPAGSHVRLTVTDAKSERIIDLVLWDLIAEKPKDSASGMK